jgi:branched-chain amino acid transport system substrate-binding protein
MKLHHKLIFLLVVGLFIPASLGILISTFVKPAPPEEYTKISAINVYAHSLPEFPDSDDRDWEDPHFLNYYHSRSVSFLTRALQQLGIWQRSAWSAVYLSKLLKQATKNNHAMGMIDGKKAVIHIKASSPTRVLVFGDVHAAFHSLVRDLLHLRESGIIDDDLKILDKNLFIVFNGDFIDRSPYSIDALILLLSIIKNNPKQVFYLAGKHERDGNWKDYGLKRELIWRGRAFSQQPVPFEKQVLDFFSSLPASVYVSGADDDKDVIRISFNDRAFLGYKEAEIDKSFLKHDESIKYGEISERNYGPSPIDVRAAFKTEEWRRHNRIKKNGLGQLDQDQGATTWAVLSSPVMVHKVFLNFHSDAFAELSIDKKVTDATITMHHQDSRTVIGFSLDPPINVISGRLSSEVVSELSLKVGSTMPLIRGLATMSRQLKAGFSSCINEFNRTDKNQGRNIRLFVDNDDYIPQLARENTIAHLRQGIRFFLSPLGTPTIYNYLDLLIENKAVVFFPEANNTAKNGVEFPNLVYYRASYESEARTLIRVMKKDFSATKFAIFYQDDSYGQGPFKAAMEELKKLGVTEILPLPYTRGTNSFATQVQQLKKFSPDALGLFSVALPTKEFIRQIGMNDLLTVNLFGLSAISEVAMKKFAKQKGLTIMYGASVPNPYMSPLPIVEDYRRAMKTENNILDTFSLEAYIGTRIFLYALGQAKSKNPSPMEVLKEVETIKNMDFHGIAIDFNPITRSLAKQVFIETNERMLWKAYPVD